MRVFEFFEEDFRGGFPRVRQVSCVRPGQAIRVWLVVEEDKVCLSNLGLFGSWILDLAGRLMSLFHIFSFFCLRFFLPVARSAERSRLLLEESLLLFGRPFLVTCRRTDVGYTPFLFTVRPGSIHTCLLDRMGIGFASFFTTGMCDVNV